MQTIVIGHKNPDMDAIVSAIAYAELKKALGERDVVAGRCGTTNERIDFVLRKFGVEPPQFFSSVRPRISDVMAREVITAPAKSPVYVTMTKISEKKFRGLPVIDSERRCLGLVSGFKISQHLFPPLDELSHAREVGASIANICHTTHSTVLAGELDDEIRRHVLVVAAMYTGSFEARLNRLALDRTVLIVGDRFNVQHIAIRAGVRALIVTGELPVGDDVLAAAREKGTIVLGSPYDTATTVLLARSAVNAEQMLDPEFESLAPDVPLEHARRQIAMSSQFAFPVVDEEGRLEGIVSKSDFLRPVPRQLVLVDHNELSQAVDGADEIPIAEILDHHRLGNAPSAAPILFVNRPVGSTSTIVATCFEQEGIPIPKPIAGILMAGLISDTLNLTSPTTTETDERLMKRLASITGLDPARVAEEIFSIGSPLLTMGASDAILADSKEYDERGVRFSVAQIEELTFAHFPEKKAALLDALETSRGAHGYLFAALLVTDINTQNSLLLAAGSDKFLGLIDQPEIEPGVWQLDGIVSRKKQLLPYLTSLLAQMS